MKFSVWFARGYANQGLISVHDSESEARDVADAAYDNGTRDLTVEDEYGAVVYEPEQETFLLDEY